MNIRSTAIRIAHTVPELRKPVLQAIVAADAVHPRTAKPWSKLPKGWTDKSVDKFWDSMTGDVKHKVTKCMKEMEGKVDNTGAFCGSLADKVEGTTKWRGKEAVWGGRRRVSRGEQAELRSDIKRRRGQRGPGGLKVGQPFEHEGERWLVYDFDRVAGAPGGITVALVSPDFMEIFESVELSGRTASGEPMIYFANGRTQPITPANGKDFKLRELQGVVGGLIEVVYLPGNQIMVVNEEGLLIGLRQNRAASRLARRPIVGDAVVMPSNMLR